MNFLSKALIKLFLSLFLFATAVGMNFVTFPAVLLKNGVNPAKIGLLSSFEIAGGILMSLILGNILKKIPIKYFLPITAVLYSFLVAFIFFCKNFYLWAVIIFAIGACWVAYVVIRQALVNMLVEDKNRGIVTGIYSMVISIGLGLGPLIVKFSGAQDYISFLISSFFIITSFLVLEKPKDSIKNTKVDNKKANFLFFLKTNPKCFLARFFFDLQNFCLLSFGVVFGKKIGFSAENSGLLITAFMASFFADILVGIILKKHSADKILNIGFIGYLACICFIAIYHSSYQILLLAYFTLGIFAACIYVSTIVMANNFYKKDQLVLANAALQSAGSSGSFFGGLIGGILIQFFDASGYLITMILSCVIYMGFMIYFNKK